MEMMAKLDYSIWESQLKEIQWPKLIKTVMILWLDVETSDRVTQLLKVTADAANIEVNIFSLLLT